ncbi:hypothetical protein [Streptomyces boninensis]|uniref:hypothetical protein n=1 Tax=Streptomyces boninensis TaxID=2039455 RepID=UPI003B21D043
MLNGLMEAGRQGMAEYTVRPYALSRRKFASFAYVADQLGYRYAGHTPGTGATNNPYFTFRRTADAPERAAAAMAEYPGILHGGPLPGMRQGGGLDPLPEVRAEVGLFYSQMVLDGCARYNRRVLPNIVLLLVAAVVILAIAGFPATGTLIAGAIWLVFFALYLLGLTISRRRATTHAARLAEAGVQWPPRGGR